MRWWEVWPNRYELEKKALEESGFRLDEEVKEGRLIFHLTCPKKIGVNKLVVLFPDSYPYFRPYVYAQDRIAIRHQNPFNLNLCLLGRSTINWLPESDTAASLIISRVPEILIRSSTPFGTPPDSGEDQQGEPFSRYYLYSLEAQVVFDETVSDLEKERCGFGKLSLREGSDIQAGKIAGVITQLVTRKREVISNCLDFYKCQGKEVFEFRWFYLDQPLQIFEPKDLLVKVESKFESPAKPRRFRGGDLTVIFFKEEVRAGELGLGAVGLLRRANGRNTHSANFIRCVPGSKDALLERVANVHGLQNKSVAIIGVGCVGSELAISLAKAGLEHIYLVDGDGVEITNSARWPLGFDSIGKSKVAALKNHIEKNFPQSSVSAIERTIGAPPESGTTNELDFFYSLSKKVDLIIDCSVEIGVQAATTSIFRWLGKPVIVASTTNGGLGGLVKLVEPNKDAPCLYCYLEHMSRNNSLVPISTGEITLQPHGCDEPTFVAASVDPQEVAIQAARVAFSCMSDSYQSLNWNFSLFHRDVSLGEAQWSYFSLEKIESCDHE